MQATFVSLLNDYWHIRILGGLVAGLFIWFLYGFAFKNLQLKRLLSQSIRELEKLQQEKGKFTLDDIKLKVMSTPKLQHLWSEFADTLHPQTEPDEFGQERVVRWRQTVPAEAYFNVEALVAVELRTEYFKHQPGILTGLGIIGTFVGLLKGLMTFNISSDPERVRASLETLVHGVLEAFVVSACAILLAMLTTFLEKLAISRRVQQVEEFCNLLDSLFDSGAGEEYLSRLVKASESSATQAAQLKDALITDLKGLLEEMTRQQSEAIAASFQQITQQHVAAIAEGTRAQVQTTEQSGDRIASAISEVLSEPIQKIAAAAQSTSDTNGQVVTRALNEALVAFSQKMEDMFGSQMTNMNQLLVQTTASMQATASRFDELAANINNAGKNAADAMSERLIQALESMEKRQELLNRTMSDFVAQLHDMVQSSQTETNQRLQDAFSLMGERLSAIVSQMEEQARKASSSHQEQQELLAQNAAKMAAELGGQIQGTLGSIQAQFSEMVQALQVQNAESAIANEKTQSRMAKNADEAIHGLADKVEKTIGNLDAKMSDFIGMLKQQIESTATTQKEAQHEITERVRVAIELLANQAQALVAETNRSVASMQGATAAMREITGESTRRMESSAATLAIAAEDFAKAGNSVSGVIGQAGQVGEKLSTTAGALSSAAAVVNSALTDYQASREAITRMVSELKIVVDAAKQDATVSQSLVNQITRSAEQLEQAHSSVEGLFAGVCNELAQAHEVFAQNVEATLKKSNGAFQKELKDAVDYLKTAVEELGDVAEAIPARR
jgi:hypothetical protein